MKKFLALMMSMAMLLMIVGCGSSDKTDSGKGSDAADDVKSEGVMTYAEYVAAELDAEVVVETYVQAKQGWWKDNSTGVEQATFYTQDKDGAYFIYNMPCSEADYNKMVPGTKIKVTGRKSEWSGEIEITEATYEIIEGSTYIAKAFDATSMLGTDDLIKHQNEFVSFKGMTVEDSGNGAAFLYNWDGSGSEGDDLYFNVSVNGATYNFVVESYLCGKDTAVYSAVKNLKIGDTVDLEGYLYWYNGANPHITALTVTAAGAGAAQKADSAIPTVTAGKLTVATSPDFAPYEFYAIGADGTPKLAGFDMALAQYVADYLKLELEVIPMDFDGVLSELAMKNVDLGMAGLSPDPDREGAMDFSSVYYLGGQSLVTVKSKAAELNSFEAVNKKSVSVGAQIGSIQMDLANTNTPDADIVPLVKVTDIISELLAGKLDAAYIETAVAESYQKNYPDLEIVLEVPYDQEGSAVGVSKGNEALLKAVNEAIAAALADGSMDNFVAEANELASGEKYEGLLDASGKVKQ